MARRRGAVEGRRKGGGVGTRRLGVLASASQRHDGIARGGGVSGGIAAVVTSTPSPARRRRRRRRRRRHRRRHRLQGARGLETGAAPTKDQTEQVVGGGQQLEEMMRELGVCAGCVVDVRWGRAGGEGLRLTPVAAPLPL